MPTRRMVFWQTKTYPTIEEPAVWTPTAKERYNDLSRQRTQTIAWDKVIQENFDWFFRWLENIVNSKRLS
jgi:hypothetical protein